MNKIERQAYNKAWREKNKEKIIESRKEGYKEHKIECCKKVKIWQEKNPERVKEIKNKWKRKYRKSEQYQLDKEKKKIQDYAYRNFRDLLIKKYGGCQRCNSKDKLEVHHKEYNNDLKSVNLLCRNCHIKVHNKLREKK